ncbi:MAG: 4Fe-4S binding protein [Planctomycetes bacterium]|nr:4Fe-4S binding protein [Planctomycetota bacterium]
MTGKTQNADPPNEGTVAVGDKGRTAQPRVGGGSPAWRLDLLAVIPGLRWLVKRRWLQFAVVFPNLVFFYLFLIAGVFGSPVGNRNIIIIFVWILWWFLLITLMVPFASRVWCTVCPFPFFGEWLQRGALIGTRVGKPGVGRNRMFGLNLRWPKALSNIWLQNFGFLGLCTFSVALVTRPIVSVFVLGGLFVVATILHLVFRQRAFCNYVCPVSGFLSLYSMTSMLEVRSKEAEVCSKCADKGCLAGNESGWGCPWFMYPSRMDRNNYCGLCTECLKTCPYDNMTLRLRPFCSDTRIKGYDESWKAFIMLTLALAYSMTLLGPWATIKDWANASETGQWGGFALYAASLWMSALCILPGVFFGSVWLGRLLGGGAPKPLKDLFLGWSYTLVPLGLLAWIAFSFPLIFVNGSYIISVLSDPMGRGWDLLGTADFKWTPYHPELLAWIQVPLLGIGLFFALRTGYRFAQSRFGSTRSSILGFSPLAVLLTAIACGFLRLFVG